MDTPHDIHRPTDLFLWFTDDVLSATEVERCDDDACAVCAAAESRPMAPPATQDLLLRAA